MAANPSRHCSVCSDPHNGRNDECPKCRARAVRWLQAPPERILQRRRNLNIWDHTLADILPGDIDRLAAKPEADLILKPPANYRPISKRTKEVVRLFEASKNRKRLK